MKKRWKGLCALWMVLILVIGAFPVAGASEDVPESAAAAVSEAAGDGGGQALTDSGVVESSPETMSESSSSEAESTEPEESESTEISSETEAGAESSAEDGTENDSEQSRESEKTEEEIGETDSTEAIEGTEEGNGESTEAENDGTVVESSEAVSEENESESGKPEESGTVEETSSEEGSAEGIPSEESSLEESSSEESSQEEILETVDPELLENAVLLAKAVAREAVTSAEVWLYVGSNEVGAGSYVGDAGSAASHRQQITVQFDASFDSQDGMKDITVPTDKKLKGWKLWGFNGSGFVTEELRELEAAGQISAEDYQNFGIDGSALSLLIVPLWRDAKDILDGDSLAMNVGDNCNLSAGTWRVDINVDAATTTDTTVYTGGRTVYAAKSGTFTFHKTE